MKEKICGIYKITSPSGKVYIGQSQNIFKRIIKYKKETCKEQVRLYYSIKKYGWENHSFEIIEKCSKNELNCRERYWQDHYDVLNINLGLNCILTECDGKVKIFSKETRMKMSNSMIGKMAGDKHPMFGKEGHWKNKKRPEISKRMSGKKHPFYGKERPKGKLSTVGGKKWNEESKNKMRGKNNPMYGKKGNLHPKFGIKPTKEALEKAKAKNSKIVLNLETGIYYSSCKEASVTYNINYSSLRCMLSGKDKNKTNLIYC